MTKELDWSLFAQSSISHFLTLVEAPFIQTQPLPFGPVEEDIQWVFFNSPSAVRHAWNRIPSTTKIAALGEGTARELIKQGLTPQFIGSHPVEKAAAQFGQLVGEGKVLFPVTRIGKRTVQKALPADQVIEVGAYETLNRSCELPGDLDVIAFTSPSNVQSFFDQHEIPKGVQLVAIGETTAEALRTKGYSARVAKGYGMLAILDRIMGLGPEKDPA
ncbi:uroporphyrinogen-III synthase [bacterium SCSIO 12741]|nr:uroporphyrinogen-III synthase [bacterium SCSIO 12741]